MSTDALPLFVTKMEGRVSPESMARYLQWCTEHFFRAPRYALVVHAVLGSTLEARQRQMQACWVKQQAVSIARSCAGAGFAMEGAAQRGVLKAIMWLNEPEYRYAIFSQRAAAVRWAIEQLPFPLRPSRSQAFAAEGNEVRQATL